ncbi:MAG TPA: helix-turn-helix transcriptional regulator [Vicinamibacteria bacterium]|nr:helix-turn-helix transcriptional regulator [Vicinamibacteria bacterium]
MRESKQIQLRHIANETRIGMAYLEDLEMERFDRFPGKFYFRSFSRAYARSLGLDPNEVSTDLSVAYEEWSGERTAPANGTAAHADEDGILHRLGGIIRRVQEV